MIQSILFFALGFLSAGFVALMVAPAIWQRAVVLTRRRIEATVPLSANEIRAEKDRLRAEHAMSTRRLEMTIAEHKEKAATHLIEMGRSREELTRLTAERDRQNDALAEAERQMSKLRADLAKRDEQLAGLTDEFAGTQAALEQHRLELERLGRAYDDATYTSSSRQIELVARESEIDKLSADVAHLRNQRKESDRKSRETATEAKAARDELKNERRKVQELEKKVERLMASVSDREEALERREKELERVREQLADSLSNETELGAALVVAEQARAKAEAEIARLDEHRSDAGGQASARPEAALERVTAERDRLEVRLAELGRENKRLLEKAGTAQPAKPDWRAEEERESALLREQISKLAAEVVSLTAALDGEGSAIGKALSSPVREDVAAPDGVVSLADRVRALQDSARRA